MNEVSFIVCAVCRGANFTELKKTPQPKHCVFFLLFPEWNKPIPAFAAYACLRSYPPEIIHSSDSDCILPSFSLAGVMRRQLLYCPIGIGYHLQILANGSVWGVHKHTDYCWVRLFAVSPGVVGILGLKSGLYLSMNKEGDLHGSGNFTEDCLFKEILEESYYNTYASHRYPGFYVGLTKQGKAKRGNKAQRHWHSTQFLPRLVHVESHT
uniref:Fibroblast growth factor n=1 Tax=Lepisosteus oculatus TaxID=7918 RepID=W5M848_LEPOC|nr:PREDICTED: fibroblast growth factor 4A-like isoform X1 [Lepisosteus oculatus]